VPTEADDNLDLLLSDLLRQPAERRAAELERVTASNPDLRERLEQLLQTHRDAGDFLEKPAVTVPEELRTPEPLECPGTVIDRYELLDLIGEGGFGAVYMAEQSEPVRRKVALKIIKLGMDTKQVIARFEAERQALTMMDHPNIAKVLDAGATETGRPYFVMELVKGDPVTEYCDRQNLGTRQRLEIFRQVCHAVQHAHQKGVIHRDLKPSNVLVTVADGQPIPKVIDFGIAKATSRELTDKTFFTEFRQLIGTPEYMSPEQAEVSGVDIDTRSDIYALGVLLYELLTGTTPFDAQRLRSAAFGELQRIIREEDPDKPSTRVRSLLVASGSSRYEPQAQAPAQSSPRQEPIARAPGSSAFSAPALRSPLPDPSSAIIIAKHRRTDPQSLFRHLRGDLDWIVMKCLEKDRTRRYETANGVASDIQRHLENQPVEAGPPTAAYRVRKFVRRNRVMVTAATMVVAALLAGTAGTTFGLLRAEQRRAEAETARGREHQQRELAEKREKETQQVSDFQAAMLNEINVEAMGHRIKERFREKVRAALQRQYVGEFPDRRKRTPEEIEDELAEFDQRARATQASDVARGVMDEFVLARAADALEKQFADQPLVRAQLHFAIGTTYRDLGLRDAAEPHLRAALEIRQRKLGDDDPDTLTSIHNMGRLLRVQSRLAEAEPHLRKALEGRRRMLGAEHRNTLASINEMGLLLQDLGEYSEAEPYLREALEGYRRVLDDDDPNTLSSIGNMGLLLDAQGKPAKAEPLLLEALEGRRRVQGDEHPSTLISIDNLAGVLQAQGKYSKAEEYRREALDGFRRVLGDEHPDTLISIHNMGVLLVDQRRLDDAEPYFREALEGRRHVHGDDHLATLDTMNSLGDLLHYQGKLAEAERYYREALDGFRRIRGDDHPDTLISIHNMACLLLDQGRLAEAQSLFAEATQAARTRLEDHPITAVLEHYYASVLSELGHLDEALDLAQTAVDRYRRNPDWPPRHASRARWVLIEMLRADGREAEALAVSWESIQAMRQRPDTTPADLASALATFAYEAITAGDATSLERAEQAARESLEIRRTVLPDGHPQVWLRYNAMSMLGEVLVGQAADPSAAVGARIDKLAEAEPLLLQAWENLKDDPNVPPPSATGGDSRTQAALERIVRLYECWDALAPDSGKAEQAAEWRAELENLPGP